MLDLQQPDVATSLSGFTTELVALWHDDDHIWGSSSSEPSENRVMEGSLEVKHPTTWTDAEDCLFKKCTPLRLRFRCTFGS
jgi:hypothetical protein